MSDEVNFLIDAGFSKEKAEKALKETKNSVQDALEWLLIHGNDVEETIMETGEKVVEAKDEQKTEENKEKVGGGEEGEANSLKCDDCGVLLKDEDFATLHAHKTGHVNFSQSVEPIKPRTKEEVEEQKKRLNDKLVQLRKEKQEKERLEAIESEKARRKQGRQISEYKQKFQEDEMKRIAEERRREKQADAALKQKIKEQIAHDRERQKKSHETVVETPKPVQVTPTQSNQTGEKKQYNECKIQIRLTNGATMVQSFKPTEQLAAVRLWVEMNRTDGMGKFNLVQPFPRKAYTEDDMMKSLVDLGLVPASNLLITPA